MARELDDWLDGYLIYTENSEPPRSYHTWAGLSMLAGALQRKVWLSWGFETIRPNMFVVLVGASGRARKGVALGIAKSMLLQVPGLAVSPESASREALILAMKRAVQNFADPDTGVISMHCSITAFSEELSVLLGQSDIKLLSNLTDWYDSKDEWAYETVGRGRDSLQGLCVNLLGATAPDWLQSMLPQEAVGGGFTSRVIFVVEENKGKTVPKHLLTQEELALEGQLLRDLERVMQLRGAITFTPAGEEAYTNWYKEQDAKLAKGHPAVDDSRFAGYCERRATHIRKLMILCSVSRTDELKIDVQDFERAHAVLQKVELKMPKTFGGLGKAQHSNTLETIKDFIKGIKTTTRKTVLSRFYRDLDPGILEEIEVTLERMGVLKVTFHPSSNDKLYQWLGE